ncbi:hypothetical protein D0859_05689 [Hortaea werneckii]|uniref:Small EDRK-rich factor-like N-terminal domain-containing protein n=1 Tax=Hortaea werneckii TaxID=91943 RepID=A0A3M7IXC4_HORWE|nr:hypothetical protein D0859_05689 [Hortaea werneckii]
MARGNQRDKAREKNQKAAASVKSKNSMSGTEYQREKEKVAAIMLAKQKAGKSPLCATQDEA